MKQSAGKGTGRMQRSMSRSRPTATWAIAIVTGIAVAVGIALWVSNQLLADSGVPVGVESYQITSGNHVNTAVSYPQNPPVGGDHSPVWQNAGFYDRPIANENAVHSMEHGAVWITYRPDLPSEQTAVLRKLARDHDFLVVSPYPGLPAPVVASVWGQQLRLESADDPRLEQFLRAFGSGSQAPEPGAPLTGGVGVPS